MYPIAAPAQSAPQQSETSTLLARTDLLPTSCINPVAVARRKCPALLLFVQVTFRAAPAYL